jgi:hypothetical protein
MGQKQKLPDFLCVGVEKCGTTSLYDLLRQHPQVGLSRFKETHFFNTHWDKGLIWYQEKFSHLPDRCSAIGDITPAYHRFPEVIPRIRQTLGGTVKILFLLREPRQRAFSHYVHDFARHQKITDLVYKRYLATTHYARSLQHYQEAFGRENCLVLIFEEDFLPDQQIMMDKVCAFLGLDSLAITPVHSNPSCLPVACWSPPRDSRIVFAHQSLPVAANSLVIYTGQRETTKILSGITAEEAEPLLQRIHHAVSFIPALKSSIIFEQNVKDELMQLEPLINRNLDVWRKPLGDLQARFAPPPVFLPT